MVDLHTVLIGDTVEHRNGWRRTVKDAWDAGDDVRLVMDDGSGYTFLPDGRWSPYREDGLDIVKHERQDGGPS